MITSYYDWEERLVEERTREALDAIAAPDVRDAAELAEIERRRV